MSYLIFFFFRTIFSLNSGELSFNYSNRLNQNFHDFSYSDPGFYSILLKDGDKISVFLVEGTQKLYLFIPYQTNFYIKELKIDGLIVPINLHPISFCIEGKNYVTITFYANNDQDNRADFWILPSSLCPKSSSYAYGSNIVEILARGTQLCVFSPTFDSKNQKFSIEAGIPLITGYHYTSFYTTNYDKPDYLISTDEIQSITIKTGSFVKFYSNFIDDDGDRLYSIFFRRKTKSIKVSENDNKCEVNAITRCSFEGCILDYVDFVSVKCNKIDVLNITVASVISGIMVLVILSLVISMYCRSKKKKNLNINEEPLNNDNDDFYNENQNHLGEQQLNDYPPQPQYFEHIQQKPNQE